MNRADTPDHRDLASALEDAREHLKLVADNGWATRADGLDWTCRETMTHILDDLGFHAMLLSGAHRVESHAPLMEFTPVPGRMEGTLWPEDDAGTEIVVRSVNRIFPHATRTESNHGE